MDIKKRIQELSLDQKAKLYFMGLVRKGIIDRLPDDPKAAYIRDMMDKEDPKMDPAIRSDFDDPMFEGKFKKGDTVIPNVGPHKGVKHEIIYDFGDGKYNIQPIGLRPNQIQYRLGATGAREDQLKMADDINEGDTYEKMAAKGKKAGNLKQGTVRKRLRIKDGEKIPLARINKAISSLKKRKSLSDKDKKYLKALNLAKTLKTTTNVKEMATELGYLNEYGEYKSQEEKFKQELDLMFKDYRPFISLGKYAGERPDSDPLKGKGFGSIEFVVPTELPPNEFKRALDWAESKGFEIKSQSNEYEVEFDRDRSYYPKIKFHFDADKFDIE